MRTLERLRSGIKSFAKLEEEDKDWVIDALKIDALKKDRRLPSLLIDQIRAALLNTTSKPHVFLSHNSKDKRFVRGLAHQLKSAGIRVWLDEAEIKVGESLIEKLREAIDSVDFLIVVLSKASVESAWVQREVDIAMNQEIKNRRVKVLPVLKESVELPGFLEGKLYLDFSTKSARSKTTQRLIQHILTYNREERKILVNGSERKVFLCRTPGGAAYLYEELLSGNKWRSSYLGKDSPELRKKHKIS